MSSLGKLLYFPIRSAYFLSSVYGLLLGSKFYLSPVADFKNDLGDITSASFLTSTFGYCILNMDPV